MDRRQKLPPWAPAAMVGWRHLGYTMRQIAAKFGVSAERVHQILKHEGAAGSLPRPLCSTGCGRVARRTTGLCNLHHARVLRTGDVGPAERIYKSQKGRQCLDCDRPAALKGRCNRCYVRHRWHTEPEFRKHRQERQMAWTRHRVATDPEYAARHRENQRRASAKWRAKQRAEGGQP